MRFLHLQGILVFIFLSFCLIQMSCKKDKNNSLKTFDFIYAGTMVERDTISFHFKGPSNDIVTWYFGDGASSTDSAPRHRYTLPGTYQVTLVIKADSMHAIYTVNKTIIITAKFYAQITHNLRTQRIWHGFEQGSSGPGGVPYLPFSYTIDDTLAFVVITDDMIAIVNDPKLGLDSCTYGVTRIDTDAKILAFRLLGGSCNCFVFPDIINYYYGADSITMSGNYSGLHGWAGVYLKTP